VIRFKYDKKYVAIDENNEATFYNGPAFDKKNQKAIAEGSPSIIQSTDSNIRKIEIFSYKDFLNIIEKETLSKTVKIYYVFYNDEYYSILVKDRDEKIRARVFYKPENDSIKELMKTIIALEDKMAKVVIGNIRNSFNFIAPNPILETLFTYYSLKERNEVVFAHRTKLKSSGKVRKYIAPHPEILVPLRKFNKILQGIYDCRNIDFQVAYKKGKNILDNATPHLNNDFLFKVDLKDFFPSCKKELVRRYLTIFFKNSSNSSVVEELFLDIILDNGALFIGNPISGTIANVIISKPVSFIRNITKKFDMAFSVYADDMTFSSARFISEEFIDGIFQVAFTRYGLDNFFSLNKEKSHGMSKSRRRVTGVSINNKNQPVVSRELYRELRVKIHKLSIGTSGINIRELRGQISFATMIDKSGKILKLLENFNTVTEQYKLVSKEKLEILKANGGS